MGHKARSTNRKDKMKKYRANGIRDINKAIKFEKWVKRFVKQSEAGKIRIQKPVYEGHKITWKKETKNNWTFGPYGCLVKKEFVENIPEWMKPIIKKYSKYYKKEYIAKIKKVKESIKETINTVREADTMHKQSMEFKKRRGARPSQQK